MFNIKDLPPIERGPNDSLPRMTDKQRREAVRLIQSLCSYNDNRNCLYLDRGEEVTCPQSISYSVCCKWFRRAVLPQDKPLEAEIFSGDSVKRCAVCGKPFVPKSNRGKYCPGCAASVHRRQKAESERKRRSSVDN